MKRFRLHFVRSPAFPEGRWHINQRVSSGIYGAVTWETLTIAFDDLGAAIDALRAATSLAELVTEYPRLKLVSSM